MLLLKFYIRHRNAPNIWFLQQNYYLNTEKYYFLPPKHDFFLKSFNFNSFSNVLIEIFHIDILISYTFFFVGTNFYMNLNSHVSHFSNYYIVILITRSPRRRKDFSISVSLLKIAKHIDILVDLFLHLISRYK